MPFFGFTIRRTKHVKNLNQLTIVESSYMYFLHRLQEHARVKSLEYHREYVEHGDALNYHIHGMFELDDEEAKTMIPKMYSFKRGYHIWIEPVSVFNWHAYITKQSITYEDITTILKFNIGELTDDDLIDINDHIDSSKYPKLFPSKSSG